MKKSRFLAFLCAILMIIVLFAGCSGESAANTQSPSSVPPDQSAAPSDPPRPPDDGYVYKMPVADSLYTITAWRAYSSTYLTSPNEILCNVELEKRTNIHLDYKLAPNVDAQTQFSLLVASDDFTDLIITGSVRYTGGDDKAIEDGIVLELTDIIGKWMPNVQGYLDTNDEIRKLYHSDAGNIAAVKLIKTPQSAWVGPGIRVDLLEKAGISKVPETYGELYAALVKFRDMGIEQPLIMTYLGYSTNAHSLTAGFDVAPDFYNENGTVKYGFLESGFREYVGLMNQWYLEGLIDRDFHSRSGSSDVLAMDRIPAGKVGVTDYLMYNMIEQYQALSEDSEFHIKAMPIIRKDADTIAHFRQFNPQVSTADLGMGISTAVVDEDRLEKIARWIDYRFSEEGVLLLNYGVEGDSYIVVDGQALFTDKVLKNPDGIAPTEMSNQLTDSKIGTVSLNIREKQLVSEEAWLSYDVWGDSASGDWVMPSVKVSTEEGNDYSTIMGDINTLVQEVIPKFITGAKPLSEYDDFIGQLQSLNIARALEIQQAALDRFLAR